MKIAYLTGEYPRVSDTFIQREVAALRGMGHTVMTCSMRRTPAAQHVGPEQRAEAAQTFVVLDAVRQVIPLIVAHAVMFAASPWRYGAAFLLALRTARPGVKGLIYQLIYFLEAAVLAHFMRRNEIEHLHNHIAKSSCSVAMITSALSGIPFSFTLHGSDIFYEPYTWRLDAKIQAAQFVACISEFCRSQAMAFSPPEAWDKLHIIHCGVEPERYADAPVVSFDPPKALFVGRLATIKGLSVLLRALEDVVRRHPKFELTIIGDGPDRARLEALARSAALEGHVHFVGSQSQEAVAQAMREASFFVLSSFAEGVPVVAMEALAAARPVIATHVAGVPELVTHGQMGYLVAPGDHAALSAAICDLISDPDRAADMGAAGQAKVQSEFDARSEAARLSQLFVAYHTMGRCPDKRPRIEAEDHTHAA